VLVAAGEEKADVGGALEDRPHPLGDGIRVSVGLTRVGHLLELVDEHDRVPAVGRRDPLRQRERIVEIAIGVAVGEPWLERDLELRAELILRTQHDGGAGGIGDEAPCFPGAVDKAVQPRPVGDRRGDERLGKLRRIRDAEEVDRDRVVPGPLGARQGSFANARLPGSAGPGDDDVEARHERGCELANVLGATDQLRGRQRQVGREHVGALNAGHSESLLREM
jgi:hypothetical protein